MKTNKMKKITLKTTCEVWGDIEFYNYKNLRILEPTVSFTAAGLTAFNKPMMTEVGLDYKHVMVGYSRHNEAIIFLFLKESNERSYRLAKGATIFTLTFFKHLKINFDEYHRRYTPIRKKLPKLGESWVIYLKKTEEAVK